MRRQKQKLTIDKPEDRLPGLEYDGEKVHCGLCGRGFQFLALHILQTHQWSLDDYREEFGLNRTQPLCTPQYSEKHRKNLKRRGQIGILNYHLRGTAKPYRRQGKLNLSDSPLVRVRQSKNGRKAHTDVPCASCGKLTKGIKTDTRKFYCPECFKSHEAEYQAQWRDNHRESCRQASARYRANHLEEVRKNNREAARLKYRLEHGIALTV